MPTKKQSEHVARVALLDLIEAIDEVRRSGRSLPKTAAPPNRRRCEKHSSGLSVVSRHPGSPKPPQLP